jgi:hypothetical protein
VSFDPREKKAVLGYRMRKVIFVSANTFPTITLEVDI